MPFLPENNDITHTFLILMLSTRIRLPISIRCTIAVCFWQEFPTVSSQSNVCQAQRDGVQPHC